LTDGPLTGCGVLITRPAHQAQTQADAITEAGGKVLHFPVLDIVGRDPTRIKRDLAALAAPDIVIFVSANAVAHGLSALRGTGAQLAAIGPATRDAIEAAGRHIDIVPDEVFDSEHLLRHPALQSVSGRNVLIVRGQSGRTLLADTLTARGARVDYLCVYERLPHVPAPAELAALAAALEAGNVHYVVAMSADTIHQLLALLPPRTAALLRKTALVAPSARVLQTATTLLPGISTVLAPGPQASAIVDALSKQWQTGRH
jgi:uroporphyrinogen-III synthase